MTQERNLNEEEITLENIFEELSDDFKAVYEELVKKLKEESKYKRLKKVGEELFYNATSESSFEMEHQNTRLCFAKITLLGIEVCEIVEAVIREKFQSSFISSFKDRVLKAVLKLHSERKHLEETAENLSPSSNPDVKRKEEEKILEKLKDLSKFCADNLIDIRNQLIEMPLEETDSSTASSPEGKVASESKVEKLKIPLEGTENSASSSENKMKKLNTDISNIEDDNSNISFDSLSSVHTSDLSSFEDEIVLSSDEESGKKRKRMSMKEVKEKLATLKAKLSTEEKDDKNEAEMTEDEDTSHVKTSASDCPSVAQKAFSQRVRKPNSKYVIDVVVTPLRRQSTEKNLASISSPVHNVDNSSAQKLERPHKEQISVPSTPICNEENSLSRKRGRPHKEEESPPSSPVCNMENSLLRKRGRPRKEKKSPPSSPACNVENSLPRKRGRPRKHFTYS